MVLEAEVGSSDLKDGRGGDKTHGAANQYLLDLTDAYYEQYNGTSSRATKHKCRDAVIAKLLVEDYRFLFHIFGRKRIEAIWLSSICPVVYSGPEAQGTGDEI